MTTAINPVTIEGGPLPSGPLCAYSYDPSTSCVYLTKLMSKPPLINTNVLNFSTSRSRQGTNTGFPMFEHNQTLYTSLFFSGVLYPGIITVTFTTDMPTGNLAGLSLTNSSTTDTEYVSLINTSALRLNTVSIKIHRTDTYYLVFAKLLGYSDLFIVEVSLPTALNSITVYNNMFDQTPVVNIDSEVDVNFPNANPPVMISYALPILNTPLDFYYPVNTSLGYIGDDKFHLVSQTLAPFPPSFYDPNWYNDIDYAVSIASNLPDLTKVVSIIDDIYASPIPSCYSIALITQADSTHQLFWKCSRVVPDSPAIAYNSWVSSESVYLYCANGVYFGGKDYSGPMNSILIDKQDGSTLTLYRVLDLNEFPINSSNQTFVYAYTCNYSMSSPIIYCVLNNSTGRMAEIDAASQQVKYFTVVVPTGNVICEVYYSNRLMYTVRDTVTNLFSLYDAHNNGILLYTFDNGTFDPSVIPQFSIIN